MAVKEHDCVNFIKRQCKLLGIDNYKIIELNSFTCGQAETSYIMPKIILMLMNK